MNIAEIYQVAAQNLRAWRSSPVYETNFANYVELSKAAIHRLGHQIGEWKPLLNKMDDTITIESDCVRCSSVFRIVMWNSQYCALRMKYCYKEIVQKPCAFRFVISFEPASFAFLSKPHKIMKAMYNEHREYFHDFVCSKFQVLL